MASPTTTAATATTVATTGWRRWIHPLQSVRVRITLAAVLVTAVAVGTAGWLLVRSVEDSQLGQVRDDINANLDEVVARLEDGADPQDAIEATTAVGFGFLEVKDERGTVVASAAAVGDGQRFVIAYSGDATPPPTGQDRGPTDTGVAGEPPPGLPGPPPADARSTGALISVNGGVAGPVEAIAREVDGPDGKLTVTAFAPVDQVSRSVDALRGRLVVGLPAVIALVAAVAWVLVGRALRQVDAIRAEVDEITGSTIHRRVPEPPTRDEVGRLARTMNAMLGRLDASATRQRQFVSDASHELRSPVAAIRTGLEVARRKGAGADWPAVADAALAEEARLEALLDDLLLLAMQDENGAVAVPSGTADLRAVTTAEADRPRRVPVEVVHAPADGEALVVAGSADQLGRAVGNLVDNAARHATSVVQISLSTDDDSVRVIVDDDGPGVPLADRDRIFERFTRLDDGRARHQGGTGLGLAVVRSIVARHGGQVRVDDSPLGGARFVAELPVTPTTSSRRFGADPEASRQRTLGLRADND